MVSPRSEIPENVRRFIQEDKGSIRETARLCGVSTKTVQKWRKRETVTSMPRGRNRTGCATMRAEQELIVAWFRFATSLPLDDLLYVTTRVHPALTRSTLYRILRRHGVGSLNETSLRNGQEPASEWEQLPGHFKMAFFRLCPNTKPYFYGLAVDHVSKIAFGHVMYDDRSCSMRSFAQGFHREFGSYIRYVTLHTPTSWPMNELDIFRFSESLSDYGILLNVYSLPDKMSYISRQLSKEISETKNLYGSIDDSLNFYSDTMVQTRTFVKEYNEFSKIKCIGGAAPVSKVKRFYPE